jgi:plasmid stabilization system protein ParE
MKRYEVLFTDHAEADFDDIADFIAADNPHKALSFVAALHDRTVAFLSVTPNAGTRVEGQRFTVFGRYVIVYRVDDEAGVVTVIIVSEGHRDWQRLLEDRT